jgi:hypothetical protein
MRAHGSSAIDHLARARHCLVGCPMCDLKTNQVAPALITALQTGTGGLYYSLVSADLNPIRVGTTIDCAACVVAGRSFH